MKPLKSSIDTSSAFRKWHCRVSAAGYRVQTHLQLNLTKSFKAADFDYSDIVNGAMAMTYGRLVYWRRRQLPYCGCYSMTSPGGSPATYNG